MIDVGGIQRSWDSGVQKFGKKARPRLARGGENIPVEILRRLSDWFAMLEERGTVPGTTLGTMIAMIATLEDSLSGRSPPYIYISTAWLMGFSGGQNSDNATSFVRLSLPILIEFFVLQYSGFTPCISGKHSLEHGATNHTHLLLFTRQ